MASLNGNIAVLFLLLFYWENGSAQSFSYYYRPGPGSEGSFNLGNAPQPFRGFSPQPPSIPFSGGTPPPGAQFYTYTLPGGNDEIQPQQQPSVVHQPIQYFQPQQQQGHQQQQQQQQPIRQYVSQPQPQTQQFIPQAQQLQQQQPLQYVQPQPQTQRVEVGTQQHKSSSQIQPSQAPRIIQQIDNGVTQVPYEIRQFYIGQQPTYSPVVQNNIGNTNRVEAINNPKGTVDVKESSDKVIVESQSNNETATQPRIRFPAKTVTLSVTHTQVRDVETSEETSEEEEEEPAPVRVLPRVTTTAAAVTTRSTTVPTTIRTTTPEVVSTTEQTRATVNEDQFVSPSPSSETPDSRSPFLQNVFPNPTVGTGSPFLPNQFSPQTQQFLPTRFTTRDPQSQFLGNQFPPSGFSPNHFNPQNQYQNFPQHQFPAQHNQFQGPEQYFQNQFPSADPPRPVQVGGNRQEDSFTFRPFPSVIPEIDNNSGEVEDEQPFVSSTLPSAPSPSPVPQTTTTTSTTSTARTASGRNGKTYYKFATPSGLYDTGTTIPLQQYSVVGAPDQSEEQPIAPVVRKGRKRIRVNRNRFRQRPAIVEQQQPIQPVIPENNYYEPIVSQAPVFINNVTPSPEEEVTTYRSKFRYTTTRRPVIEPLENNQQNSNVNTNTDEAAQDAISRRLQTLQRQIRFKSSNKNQDRKSG